LRAGKYPFTSTTSFKHGAARWILTPQFAWRIFGEILKRAIFRQRSELLVRVLGDLSNLDRKIRTRFYMLEQSVDEICSEMALTETQFRLLKSRATARFGELGKKKIAHRA